MVTEESFSCQTRKAGRNSQTTNNNFNQIGSHFFLVHLSSLLKNNNQTKRKKGERKKKRKNLIRVKVMVVQEINKTHSKFKGHFPILWEAQTHSNTLTPPHQHHQPLLSQAHLLLLFLSSLPSLPFNRLPSLLVALVVFFFPFSQQFSGVFDTAIFLWFPVF